MGYYPVFAPPSPQAVAEAFGHGKVESYRLPFYHARIATDRVMIQMGTIVVVIIAAVVLLSGQNRT